MSRTLPLEPHQRAVEDHSMQRLEERYGVPRDKSFDLYFEHLAYILAGEGDVRAWWSHGAQLILLPMEDKDYWVIYRPDMSRIVTYLPLHPRLPKLRGVLRTSIVNALRVKLKAPKP